MTFSNNLRESINNTNEGDIKELFLFIKVHKDQVIYHEASSMY